METQRTTLVEELRALLAAETLADREQVESIKSTFYHILNEEQEAARQAAEEAGEEYVVAADQVESDFRDLLAVYKQRRQEELKKQTEQQEQNLLRKENIIAQMKAMAEAETADVMGNLQKMRELQAEWKSIGAVPAPKVQELNKQYNLYQEQFYDLVKINIELRDLDFKRNLELKTSLCERAEALAENPSIVEANRQLQAMHEEWANIGPVAREEREALWNRFKEASTVINKKHQAYFDDLHKKEEENLQKKQALIERLQAIDLESLKSNKAWEEATNLVQEIQSEWRTIGFAPKKYNQSIYEQYRQITSAFYVAKSAFYKEIRDRFSGNLKAKRELIARAKELKDSTDWNATAAEFRKLQDEWKKIGPVARKYSDQLWSEFTAAADAFFNARRAQQKEERPRRHDEKGGNWRQNIASISDRARLMRLYENLETEIRTAENNILFFTSKHGNALVDSLQKKIDTLRNQLSDLENKIKELDEKEVNNE